MKGKYTYRIKYEKQENARYISHLDFVRVMNRAIRRSGLAVTYTIGFNPHPVFTVAMPISVGVTSECEYMDIDFDEAYEPDYIKTRFNEIMPKGITFTKVALSTDKTIKYRDMDSAVYVLTVEAKTADTPDIDSFLRREEIIVTKKSKSSTKDVNIRNDIYSIKMLDQKDNMFTFELHVPAGNNYNLKPELVIQALSKYENFEYTFIQSHRTALLAKNKSLI